MVRYLACDKCSKLLKVTYENNQVNDLKLKDTDNTYLRIDWSYVIDEDGMLEYTGKDGKQVKKEVKAGDIVFQHYNSDYTLHFCTVIHSDELLENIEYEKKLVEERNAKYRNVEACVDGCVKLDNIEKS